MIDTMMAAGLSDGIESKMSDMIPSTSLGRRDTHEANWRTRRERAGEARSDKQ